MMDRAWLSTTVEEALEPELEICDPHHHLWETETKYGHYDLDDLRTDTGAGHRVTQTVFIDCTASYRTSGPTALAPVGETEFVMSRALRSTDSTGSEIAGIVSHADLTLGAGVEDVLLAHVAAATDPATGLSRFRGIRHAGGWDASPDVPNSHSDPPAGLYGHDDFRAGAAVLARLGMSFEAWQYHPQLPDVVALAQAQPGLSIVVNHLGGPLGIGPYAGRRDEVLDSWRPPMRDLARLPNVSLKVGGIGMTRFGMGFELADRAPTSDELVQAWGDELRWCIDLFGPDRAMFESNFPVDGESCGYTVLWNAFKKVSSTYSPTERDALFRGTATRVYRLDPVAPATTDPSR